jgi:lysosomal acid lipase/cholesteryl ester hydrolase
MPKLEKITRYGYTGEVHKVTTDDGYILTVYRITGSRSSPPSSKKPPVFLNHGLFANGHIWMLQHGSRSLAFKLADNGFDVWIGNSRGTDHSLEHIRLLSNESMYWNFTLVNPLKK